MNDSSLKVLEESNCTYMFFIRLAFDGLKELVNWCMNVGLIASTYECPNCGRNMNLYDQKETTTRYEWRCSKRSCKSQHNVNRSIIDGSCFSYINLGIFETLSIMRFWFYKDEFLKVEHELGIDDHQLIADSYNFCREVCVVDLINNSDKIGGKGVNIEMDVCKLGEMKYCKDKLPNGHWIIGGYERKTKKCFYRIVENNTKKEFLKIISEWILPGSVVMSDCYKLYDCHSDQDFVHLCTANNLTFKPPFMNERNKAIDAARSTFEGPLRNDFEVVFDSYLGEYIWRKKHSTEDLYSEKFKLFLKAVIENYRPLRKDNQS